MSGRAVFSIRWVVTATTVALIAASVLGVGAMSERNTRRALLREVEARTVLEARNLALTGAGALLSDFPELTLTPVIQKMLAERPELSFVVVVDHQGRIQGHRDARQLGQLFVPPPALEPMAGTFALQPGERLLGNSTLLVVESPVSHPRSPRLGRAWVGVRRAYLDAAISAARREQFLFLALLLLVGVSLGLLVVGALLRPVAALRAGLERIGRGDLDTPLEVRDRTELGLLADAVNDMASRLQVARRETVERERLAHELELARDIQQRLLPRQPRAVGGHVLAGSHRAAAEVGGDYYDYFALPDGRVALAIADVSGKGLAGCLVTSMLAASLRALHPVHASPSALLIELERNLATMLESGEFVTMFYGVLEPRSGRLTWASAGHMPLLVWRAADGQVERHATQGIPLGAVRGGALAGTLADRTLVLEPGDLALQFTDGVSEAFGRDGEMFGFERIDQVLVEHASQGADATILALARAVADWCGGDPQDDETMVVVARDASAVLVPGSLAHSDPLERLAEAQSRGVALELTASLEGLSALGEWLECCPDLRELDGFLRRRLELALYEACANVAEHGLSLDPAQRFHLYWVPANGAAHATGDLDARVRAGWFAMCDRGFPFSPGRWHQRDLADASRRTRGRGFGLDLIHLAMDEVLYRPATEAGNVTLLTFDPARARQPRQGDQHG